jgi:hypothetical protein
MAPPAAAPAGGVSVTAGVVAAASAGNITMNVAP